MLSTENDSENECGNVSENPMSQHYQIEFREDGVLHENPMSPSKKQVKKFSEESVPDNTQMDEMKIQTMYNLFLLYLFSVLLMIYVRYDRYKMVDDVTASAGGLVIPRKVLYLTNKQARLFDGEPVTLRNFWLKSLTFLS